MLFDEVTILTATGATTDQTSKTFLVPTSATGCFIYTDVTVGESLEMDFSIEIYTPGPDEWITLLSVMPSSNAISGVGLFSFLLSNLVADIAQTEKRMPLGGKLRLVMDHGTATAATYKVYIQPV